METNILLMKIAGVIIFIYSLITFTRHLKKESKEAKEAKNQSRIERVLNGTILYIWYLFIFAFSIGMVFNN